MSDQGPTSLDRMQSAIQLAGFHYIACMKAVPTNADYRVTIENKEYTFDAIRRTDSRQLHVEFQKWAAMAVLRDLIESFSVFLMEIYGESMQANPGAAYSATLDRFERKGIEDQLDVFANDLAIDAVWISRLVGYNRARNCLAHRRGIVGPRDANDGNELVVRWLVSKMEIVAGPSTPFVEAVGPMASHIRGHHIHGQAARLEIHDKEKRIAVGLALEFLPTDVLEICSTFQMAAAAFKSASPRS